MATKLLYLDDFDVTACQARVIAVEAAEDGYVVIVDQTCFYPRGGGQDWDTGNIASAVANFEVAEVRLDEHGIVRHITFTKGHFAAGDAVECKVDAARRSDNTRLHSAGHLVDMAVQQLDWPWVPGRGAHYPHMSFVEYDAPDAVVTDELIVTLQAKVEQLLQSNYRNKILFMPVAEMRKYCRYVPDNIPTNKPSRIVLYADDFGIPCGGTHVRQVRDIGAITITKIKAKKGVIKVSYAVSGIN